MTRYLLSIAISAFWLHAMTLLALKEIVPAFRDVDEGARGLRYADLSAGPTGLRVTRMGLYKIGPGHGARALRRVGGLERRVLSRGGTVEIRVRMSLDMDALAPWARVWSGKAAETSFSAKAVDGRLVSLQAQARIHGRRAPIVTVYGSAAGDKLSLRVQTPLGELTRVVNVDPRYVIGSAESPVLGMPRLHVGRRWKVRVLDPFSGRFRERWAEVTGRDTIHWRGEDHLCFLVEMDGGRFKSVAWVDDLGRVLKLSSMGFVFLLEPAGQENSGEPIEEQGAAASQRKAL